MGSAGAKILFLCIALFMVAAVSASPDNSTFFISRDALAFSSNPKPASSPAPACPVRIDQGRLDAVASGCGGSGQIETTSQCCKAFKALACSYGATINDLSNGCAGAMFDAVESRAGVAPSIFKCVEKGARLLECA